MANFWFNIDIGNEYTFLSEIIHKTENALILSFTGIYQVAVLNNDIFAIAHFWYFSGR